MWFYSAAQGCDRSPGDLAIRIYAEAESSARCSHREYFCIGQVLGFLISSSARSAYHVFRIADFVDNRLFPHSETREM